MPVFMEEITGDFQYSIFKRVMEAEIYCEISEKWNATESALISWV